VLSGEAANANFIVFGLKMATEKDFLEAVNKVIKAYAKFSSTPRYMTYK
jgi:ATP-dependent 26S proteasome regulatory subunit